MEAEKDTILIFHVTSHMAIRILLELYKTLKLLPIFRVDRMHFQTPDIECWLRTDNFGCENRGCLIQNM